MVKTATKFLTVIFCGLFLSAVLPLPVSAAGQQQKERDDENLFEEVVKMEDARAFMRRNISGADYEALERFVGKEGNADIIPCGEVLCNLTYSSCLYKVEHDESSWFGRQKKTSEYEYICVPKAEAASKNGWTAVAKDHENLKKSVTTTKNGKVIKDKSKTHKVEETHCYQAQINDPNQKKEQKAKQYCVEAIGGELRVYSANDEGTVKCEVVPVNWYNNKQCRFCSLLGVLYNAADNITLISYNKLAPSFAILIALGMAIWIAMKTLAFVSSATKQDAAKYITEMLKQSYKVVIAFFLLVYYNDVFKFIIHPLLLAGLEFGEQFVQISLSWEDRFEGTFQSLSEQGKLPLDYRHNVDNTFYSVGIYQTMEHFAFSVNAQYALLQTVGSTLMCLGWKYITLRIITGIDAFGLGFACIIYGFFFWGFGFLLCLAFIFYLLDAVVQLGIVGALLPFLIASWPFKITSKYTSTGFKMLLNSIFTFMMMGIIVKISMRLINTAVMLNSITHEDGTISSGLADLVDALDKINTERLKDMVNILSVGFLLFMFANIFGFLLLGRVSELVNRFASGGMKASAPSIATMGASAVKGMATKVAAPTGEAINEWAEEKAEKGVRWTVDKAVGIATLRPVRNWMHRKQEAKSAGNPKNQKAAAPMTSQTATSDSPQQNNVAPVTLGNGAKANAQQSVSGAKQPTAVGGGSKAAAQQNKAGGVPSQTAHDNKGNPAGAVHGAGGETRQTTDEKETQIPQAEDQNQSSGTVSPAAADQRRKGNFGHPGKPTTVGNGHRPDKKKLDELD